MAYCVKCGVELSDGEKKCPLCNTPVILPEEMKKEKRVAEVIPIFPMAHPGNMPQANKKSILELVSLIFFLPIPVLLLCDINIADGISWSGYAVGGIFLLYVYLIFPFIPKKGNAVVSILADWVCTLAYVFYIEKMADGAWFIPFAAPLISCFAFLAMVIALFRKYTKISNLELTGMSLVFIGLFCLVTEFLINSAFSIHETLYWAFYPALSLAMCAIVLFYIDRNAALKEKIKRKLII